VNFALLRQLSWPELRHHPWRHVAALLAVTLGVALAFSVHLINASALAEFGAAVRAINGDADLELVGPRSGFDEALYGSVAKTPGVAVASPVVEAETFAFDAAGRRVPIRVVGIDAFVVARLAPAMLPRPRAGSDRFAAIDPGVVFSTPPPSAASAATRRRSRCRRRKGRIELRVAGSVAAAGPPLAGDGHRRRAGRARHGRPSAADRRAARRRRRPQRRRRIASPAAGSARRRARRGGRARLQRLARLSRQPHRARARRDVHRRVSSSSRSSRFRSRSACSRSRCSRCSGFRRESGARSSSPSRRSSAPSAASSASRSAPRSPGSRCVSSAATSAAATFPASRLAQVRRRRRARVRRARRRRALVGGWVPARSAERIVPAQALKGLGMATSTRTPWRLGVALIVVGAALALLPPLFEIPLAAYLSVGLLLIGGIACVPGGVGAALAFIAEPRHPLALLAVERARYQRASATIATAGVVASLALSVALTVMVASFREGVLRWLDVVLPADLYVRAAVGPIGSEIATLPPRFAEGVAAIPGVARVDAQRAVALSSIRGGRR
jgi:putative ABC transport system permease protein